MFKYPCRMMHSCSKNELELEGKERRGKKEKEVESISLLI